MKDVFNRDLIVEDVVAWAVKRGSRLCLRSGVIVRAEPKFVVVQPRGARKSVLRNTRGVTYIGRFEGDA